VIEIPLIRFARLATFENSRQILEHIDRFDWIIFTSANAIRIFFDLLPDPAQLEHVKFACVGRKTSELLTQLFRRPDFVPERFSSETLAGQIQLSDGERVLLPGPKVARPKFMADLRDRKAIVTQWPLYETVVVEIDSASLAELRAGTDAVTFASPSVVDSFCCQLTDYRKLLGNNVVACIGTTTSRRAAELGVQVDIVPAEFTIQSLVESLARYSRWKTRT
jgi:uroporphyrinogen-III synthase